MHREALLMVLIFSLAVSGCETDQQLSDYEVYEGPLRILQNAVIERSDSATITGRLTTPELHEFKTGDRELPSGGYVEFYDKFGQITATLRSNYGYYNHEEQIWRIEGDVILTNAESGETLYTEELFWDPSKGDVYTEKFVRIENGDEILTGVGLTAKQDFSAYIIKEPQGVFNLEEI